MARIPDLLARREIKYGEKSTPADKIRLGDLLRSVGQRTEALEVYLLADHQGGIQEMLAEALSEGRPSILILLRRHGHTISHEQWVTCGMAAEKAGRWRESYRSFIEAGDEDAVARVQENLPGYELYVPAGK